MPEEGETYIFKKLKTTNKVIRGTKRHETNDQLPIKSSLQVLVGNVKVIVCVLPTGEGVGTAGVLAQELAVFVLFGILLGSQEQHVFTEVRQARDVHWVR